MHLKISRLTAAQANFIVSGNMKYDPIKYHKMRNIIPNLMVFAMICTKFELIFRSVSMRC